MEALASNGSVFVIVGYGGAIFVSSDHGKTWSAKTSGTDKNLWAVCYGNGRFVAVGDAGTVIYSGGDGGVWQAAASGTTERLYGVACGGQRFVAVGDNGTAIVSQDGQSWQTAQDPPTGPNYLLLRDVGYGPGGFVAVADGGYVYYSSDGDSWHQADSPTGKALYAVAFGAGRYVVAGDDGVVLSSP